MARVRISDIAQEAGVSPATVSRYLNNRPGSMSEETRARIAEVIERTGYRPNSAARSLRTDRSYALGVILADIRNPFSSAMLEELSTQAAQKGYSLMTAVSGNDPETEAGAVERLLAAGVDGLVVNTCGGNDAALVRADARVPVALLDRDIPGSPLDLVTSNNAELVMALVDELAQAGCASCHLLTEHDASSSIRHERAVRFERELASRGLAGSVCALDRDAQAAAGQLRALAGCDADGAPTGLVAINGLVFLRLVEALHAADLAVPTQARVATFDEYVWNRALFGGVTTAAQDTHGIAAALLERLFARMGAGDTDAPRGPRRIEIPGSIIRRASTAA